jgi:hypothetical protein
VIVVKAARNMDAKFSRCRVILEVPEISCTYAEPVIEEMPSSQASSLSYIRGYVLLL